MLKKTISLLECKSGDVIASNITNKYGTSIIVKDTIINDYMRQKLIYMGIDNVNIYEMDLEDKFIDNYYHNLDSIRQVVIDLAAGNGLNFQKIKKISDTLYNQVNCDSNLVLNLSRLRQYDENTYSHCLNVSMYSALLGKWLNLTQSEINNIIQAGILHDIGKIKINKDILNKNGSLLPDEYEIIKKHTVIGYDMIVDIDDIKDEVKIAVLLHHERANGLGYPHAYRLDNLNLFSRVIAIADVYDAITSDRVYKKRSTPFEAFEWFLGPGLTMFDVSLASTFLKKISSFYVGAEVFLNTGEKGKIVYIPPHNISKPIIQVRSSFIDLSTQTNRRITKLN